MTQTEHYHLNQWDAADPVRREDFNADNAKIDAALHGIQSEAAAGLQALAGSVSASLGSGGKTCRIAYGSYTGTGKVGSGSPKILTFDFSPHAILIAQEIAGYEPTVMIRGEVTSGNRRLSWSGKSVSWYDSRDAYYATSTEQLDNPGIVYHYVALGY